MFAYEAKNSARDKEQFMDVSMFAVTKLIVDDLVYNFIKSNERSEDSYIGHGDFFKFFLGENLKML